MNHDNMSNIEYHLLYVSPLIGREKTRDQHELRRRLISLYVIAIGNYLDGLKMDDDQYEALTWKTKLLIRNTIDEWMRNVKASLLV